jgi:hypothetical protein
MKFSSFVGEPLELPQTVPSTRRVMQLLLLRREQRRLTPTNRILTLVAEELVSFYAESDFLISLNSKANIYKYVVSVSLGLVNFDAEYMIQRLDILLLSLLMP